MGIDIAQLPESYTLTLTLSHTWERECGPYHHWRFSRSSSMCFRITGLLLDGYTASREFKWDSNEFS